MRQIAQHQIVVLDRSFKLGLVERITRRGGVQTAKHIADCRQRLTKSADLRSQIDGELCAVTQRDVEIRFIQDRFPLSLREWFIGIEADGGLRQHVAVAGQAV